MNKQKQTRNSGDEYYKDSNIQVSGRPRAMVYEADLHGYIQSPSQFSSIISVLGMMDEDDIFTLNIQSGGGDIDSTDSLIHAFRKCRGTIHAVCSGSVSSAATFILLECDSYELSEGFHAVCHSGSLGSGGTYSEYRQQTAFYNKFMEKTLRSAYAGMFSDEELDAMLNGRDFILDAQEWSERYEKRNKYFEALAGVAQECEQRSCGSCKPNEQMSVEEIHQQIDAVLTQKPKRSQSKKA